MLLVSADELSVSSQAAVGRPSVRYDLPMRFWVCCLALFSLSAFAARETAPWTVTVQPLVTPAGGASAEPQLSVSDRGVLLSWIERAGNNATLRFSERTATGWTSPREVASGSDWFVNWADVPSVLRLSSGVVVAHWLQKSASDTYAYDVRLSYSKDDGRSWSPSFTPHHDKTNAEHGFASLFEMPAADWAWCGSTGAPWRVATTLTGAGT
jgi:hypothetical protein